MANFRTTPPERLLSFFRLFVLTATHYASELSDN
jgi:hypothetical protein